MRIRIKETPPGSAPKWARDAWIGMELDAEYNTPKNDMETLIYRQNSLDYRVSIDAALEALKLHNPEVYKWWKENCKQPTHRNIVLCEKICEKVGSYN